MIPAWIFLVVILYILLPEELVVLGMADLIKMLLFLLIAGFIWSLCDDRARLYESQKYQHLAIAEMIDKKPHEFGTLTEGQEREIARFVKDVATHEKPWRVPLLYLPWVKFGNEIVLYIRASFRRIKSKLRR